jgi:adenosylcobinamide kinase/adenosylcobinamide-phosphate guanylyltransferase
MILVVGGASSGKSQRALDLAGAGRPRAFVATGQALDPEMEERITRHRAARAKDWQTVEVPLHLAPWFFDNGLKFQSIVLDCLTLWLSNLHGARVPDDGMPDKVAELLEAMRKSSRRVVIVSNELGMGLVPVGRAVRKFRELAGKVNQMVAAEADEVYFVISGQSLRLK